MAEEWEKELGEAAVTDAYKADRGRVPMHIWARPSGNVVLGMPRWNGVRWQILGVFVNPQGDWWAGWPFSDLELRVILPRLGKIQGVKVRGIPGVRGPRNG